MFPSERTGNKKKKGKKGKKGKRSSQRQGKMEKGLAKFLLANEHNTA